MPPQITRRLVGIKKLPSQTKLEECGIVDKGKTRDVLKAANPVEGGLPDYDRAWAHQGSSLLA
jgi:hypothetical protein